MLTASFRRKTLLLLLITALATPWAASAAGPQAESPRPVHAVEETSPIFGRIWKLLAKAGCNIDPWGRCTPQTKEGCHIDPWGRCLSQAKEGCGIDPNGRCLP
jgi:hypothetical protein